LTESPLQTYCEVVNALKLGQIFDDIVTTNLRICGKDIRVSQWRRPSPNRIYRFILFFLARQPLVGLGFLITEASRSHSGTPHAVALICTSDQADAEAAHNTHNDPGGIRVRSSSKRAAVTLALHNAATGIVSL